MQPKDFFASAVEGEEKSAVHALRSSCKKKGKDKNSLDGPPIPQCDSLSSEEEDSEEERCEIIS